MSEMKDSGIEWVGLCPRNWKIMANKYIMKKIKVIKPKYRGENILSLTMNGVIIRDLEAGGKMPSSFDGYQTLYPNNLLMCLFDYDVTPRCRILNGTKKAEFAIIVISENFFDREWTERELAGFLNRQNRNGQKLILPILHNITTEQLKAKYPLVADIQAIDSAKYSCDQIALLFARQLIKRLKNA